jgi:NTP pyrophosphatase (non-canonical NTP hydrolase)
MLSETEHLLTCLAEECAEISEQCARVAVRVSKALRFGLGEVQPGQLLTNAERIAAELADLAALVATLEGAGIIGTSQVARKREKLKTFMDYAKSCGTLADPAAGPDGEGER